MTFTVMARCDRSGRLGMCTTSFSPIAGSRVPGIVPGVGILAIMSFAAPAMVMYGQRQLRSGCSAREVLSSLRANDPYPEHRQVGVIDAQGQTAANTGSAAVPYAAHRCGDQFIVLGNVVASEAVVDAMFETFAGSEGEPLAERLLRGIEAGRDAGGQLDGQRSAFLKLATPQQESLLADFRVDFNHEPVGALRETFERALNEDPRWADQVREA